MMLSCAVLAVTSGLWIPSDVIVANPHELINVFISSPHTPITYLISSFLIAFGLFMIWIPLFSYLIKEVFNNYITYILLALSVIGVVNYSLFNKNFGLLSTKLIYDEPMAYSFSETLLNLLIDLLVASAAIALCIVLKKHFKFVMLIILTTTLLLSIENISLTQITLSGMTYRYSNTAEDVRIPMSTTGQNVVVIMADRFMSAYIPYIFNERPDVAEQFEGFTYYPNTLSFGEFTNIASPALFGGYEYTPDAINERQDELLVDKHNEALMVLPVIFSQNGWNVSVGDPTYANYEWIPDPSIFDDYEGINAFQMAGVFNDRSDLLLAAGQEYEDRLNRNLFCYGLMKTTPYLFQPYAYSEGSYEDVDHYFISSTDIGYVDKTTRTHSQIGIYEAYFAEYLALDALSDIVEISNDNENNFFIFSNGTAHNYNILSEPEYMPAVVVDNTEFDLAHEDRFTVNGVTMHLNPSSPAITYANYECCMSTCIALGRWFDYLRSNNLYDNTRIVIVADHGNLQHEFDSLDINDWDFSAQAVNPLLMVKDFGSTDFTISTEFMTNADTPYIALEGLINNPVNPFTGNPIEEFDKTSEQLVYVSNNWDVIYNHGTQFEDPDGYWVAVRNNIFDDENWRIVGTTPNG